MKNRFPAFLAAFIIASPVFSASPEELVGAARATALRAASEPVTEVQTKNPSPKLLPEHNELQRIVRENMGNLAPNILVETLFLIGKPSGREANGTGWSETERTGLFNRLVAIKTLSGIQYYSESRKAMRVFYESSQIIDNPSDKKSRSRISAQTRRTERHYCGKPEQPRAEYPGGNSFPVPQTFRTSRKRRGVERSRTDRRI